MWGVGLLKNCISVCMWLSRINKFKFKKWSWSHRVEPLTAFTVYGMGQYKFTTSPMGIPGCPASFQWLMEEVTKDLPNVIVYIDDILVHLKTHQQHQQILTQLFQRLSLHNLKIRLKKCHFATTELEYLGSKLTPKGILPGMDKTQTIKDAKPPTTVHQVRQFLGLCNFFCQHIKQFALRSHPLTTLTRKDCQWKGGPLPPDALKAFNELKSCLTSQPIVSFPKETFTICANHGRCDRRQQPPCGHGSYSYAGNQRWKILCHRLCL